MAVLLGDNTQVKGAIDDRDPRGRVTVGRDCLIEAYVVTNTEYGRLTIGNNVFIGNESVIDCLQSIEIEDDVLIAYRCIVTDHNSHSVRYSVRRQDLADFRRGCHD